MTSSNVSAPARPHWHARLLLLLLALTLLTTATTSTTKPPAPPPAAADEDNDPDAKCPLAANEREVLLELFEHTNGPSWRRLDNWASEGSPCGQAHGENNWIGVICGVCDAAGIRHVEVLGLEWNQLDGPLPARLGELSHLQVLNLGTNSITGTLPESIGQMQYLRALKVSYNQMSGKLPSSLQQLSMLELLEISYNDFVGNINPLLFAYPRMKRFVTRGNRGLSGDFTFAQPAFEQMKRLRMFDVHWNNVGGTVPPALLQLQELEELVLSQNSLSGPLPSTIDTPALRMLHLSNNYLNGSLPTSIHAPQLTDLRLERNYLTGIIPAAVGGLQRLEKLHLTDNLISGQWPAQLFTLSRQLKELHVGNNEFDRGTEFPAQIVNLTALVSLDVHGCALSGALPPTIGTSLPQLRSFDASNNMLSGTIPSSMGSSHALQVLKLRRNHLTGAVPDSFGRLRMLQVLMLHDNALTHVSERVGDCASLTHLLLHNNAFRQPVPAVFGYLDRLKVLTLHNNHFHGTGIPQAYAQLSALTEFTAHHNDIDGDPHPYIDSAPPNPYNAHGGTCGDLSHHNRSVSFFRVCGTRNDFYVDTLLTDPTRTWLETHGANWHTCYGKCRPNEAFEAHMDYQRTSRYRDMYEIADKAKFAHYMSKAHAQHGDMFNFHPRAYRMPFEYDEWLAAHTAEPNGYWLLKPTISCCGQNIRLIDGPDDPTFPQDMGNWIIQRFVHPPHLVHGHKYVLRLFAIVTSFSPLRVYLHPDGDVFYSHSNYTLEPDKIARSRGYFITDYFFTKKQRQFYTSSQHLFHYFKHELGLDTDQMWRDVTAVVVKALMATEPRYRHEESTYDQQRASVYEVLGYDIVIDERLKPWVCEVNTTPNLGLEINKANDPVIHEEDFDLKTRIMRDTLAMVGVVNTHDPGILLPRHQQRACERAVDARLHHLNVHVAEISCGNNDNEEEAAAAAAASFSCVTRREQRLLQDFECEYTHQGEFVLVFPAHDANVYLPYFPVRRREQYLMAWWYRQRTDDSDSATTTPWSQVIRREFRELNRSDAEWEQLGPTQNVLTLKWNTEEDGVMPQDDEPDRYILDDGDHFSVDEFPEDREWAAPASSASLSSSSEVEGEVDDENVVISGDGVVDMSGDGIDPRALQDGPIDEAPEWLKSKM